MSKIKKLKRSHFCFSSRGLKKVNYYGKTYLVKEKEFIYGNILLYFEYRVGIWPSIFNISSNNFTAIRRYINFLSYCKRQHIIDYNQNVIEKDKLMDMYVNRDMKLFNVHYNLYDNELVRFVFNYAY